MSNVIQLAQQLGQTTYLDSERLQKARALFEDGKYQELNKVLNEQDIGTNAQYFLCEKHKKSRPSMPVMDILHTDRLAFPAVLLSIAQT